MTDDRLKGFNQELKSNKTAATNNADGIALDDMGIPILDEIVTQNADTKSSEKTTEKPNGKITLPNNEVLVKALRTQLKSQINKDINQIAEKVAVKVVTSMTSELKQQVQSKLKDILQNNIDEMVNKAISDIPKDK